MLLLATKERLADGEGSLFEFRRGGMSKANLRQVGRAVCQEGMKGMIGELLIIGEAVSFGHSPMEV